MTRDLDTDLALLGLPADAAPTTSASAILARSRVLAPPVVVGLGGARLAATLGATALASATLGAVLVGLAGPADPVVVARPVIVTARAPEPAATLRPEATCPAPVERTVVRVVERIVEVPAPAAVATDPPESWYADVHDALDPKAPPVAVVAFEEVIEARPAPTAVYEGTTLARFDLGIAGARLDGPTAGRAGVALVREGGGDVAPYGAIALAVTNRTPAAGAAADVDLGAGVIGDLGPVSLDAGWYAGPRVRLGPPPDGELYPHGGDAVPGRVGLATGPEVGVRFGPDERLRAAVAGIAGRGSDGTPGLGARLSIGLDTAIGSRSDDVVR